MPHLTVRGTHKGDLSGVPATGRCIEITDVTMCRLRDGKIIEQKGLSDNLALYQQLDLIELPETPA